MRSANRSSRRRSRRRNWRKADARRVLAGLAASGLTCAAYGRRIGVPVTRMRWWQKRLVSAGDAPVRPEEAVAFVRVEASKSEEQPRAPLEVVVDHGLVVRVAVGFDEATLVRLVRALAAAC